MRTFAAAAVLATLCGCASAPPPLITGPAEALCIASDKVAGRRVSGPTTIDFEMTGGLVFRNHLASVCPGLQRLGSSAAISAESSSGGQLCRGDRVRVFEPVEAKGARIESLPSCVLGTFQRLPAGS